MTTTEQSQGVPLEPNLETTPRLRFTDENGQPYPKWEEKKLGEVAKIRIGFTPSTSNSSYWEGENQWLAVSGINSRRTNKGTKTISDEAAKEKKPFPPGTLLMSFKLSVGKLTITDIPIYTNEAICGFELSNDIQRDYLMYALEIADLTKGSERAVKGITLNKAKIVQIPLPLPSLPEQEKIGEFLSALDDEVEQAERLVSLLSDRKRAYAQGIFNRTLRFHDDNGNPYPEWEEKKLGEMGEWKSNSGFAKKHINPEGTNSLILYGELYTKYDGKSHINKIDSMTSEISTRSVSPGDLLFPSSGETKSQIIRCLTVSRKNDTPIYTSGDLLILSPSTEFRPYSLFISSYINSPSLNRKMRAKAQGNSVVHMSKGAWENCSIPLPSIPEQEKIGSFLSALDDEIDEAKRELELLKEQKKAYAQRIFGV